MGVRLGETITQDMAAVRIGPDMRMASVVSPDYWAGTTAPRRPRDLANHNCINLRFPTLGGLCAWEFEKGDRMLNARVDSQFTSMTSRSPCKRRWEAQGSLIDREIRLSPTSTGAV